MTASMQFHEVANIFPMMSAGEFESLKADIQSHGLIEPIWLSDGLIIDGRNRYQACVDLGIEPRFREWDGNGSLVTFVVSLNLHRRHLSESQRGMVAAKLANMGQGERTDLQLSANLQKVSRAEAAELLSVSERTVNAAAKVKDAGAAELVQAVETGRASVSAAAEVATLPQEKQAEIVAKGEVEIMRAAKLIKAQRKETRQAEKRNVIASVNSALDIAGASKSRIATMPHGSYSRDGHLLIHGDNTDPEVQKIALAGIGRVALAFADPPYNSTSEEWDGGHVWRQDFLAGAADVVAVTPGISSIQAFMQATEMPYRWSTATWITNGMARGALGFGNWIYTAIFSNLKSIHRNQQDFEKVTIRESDKFGSHELGAKRQKPPEYLTWLFSLLAQKGDVILDPFAGSGTSVIVAHQLGMRCVAIEKNRSTFEEMVARIDYMLNQYHLANATAKKKEA